MFRGRAHRPTAEQVGQAQRLAETACPKTTITRRTWDAYARVLYDALGVRGVYAGPRLCRYRWLGTGPPRASSSTWRPAVCGVANRQEGRSPVRIHPQAQAFLDVVADAPHLDTQSAEQNRADLLNALPLTGPPSVVASVQDVELVGPAGPIPARIYRPRPDAVLPGVAYFHGGGWVLGGPDLADTTARDIAAMGDVVVVSVDYRLAPETRFPGAVEDAEAVTRALLQGQVPGVDPARIAVAGDSAGGNLAAVVAAQLRAEAGLRHQVLIYPVTQARVGSTGSYREFADGHFLTLRDMQYFFDCYAPGVDPDDPRLAPLASKDLSGLAPATVITAECDPLRDEGEAYAAALRDAGVPVTTRRFDGQVHPFVYMAGLIDAAVEARQLVGNQLRAALHPHP